MIKVFLSRVKIKDYNLLEVLLVLGYILFRININNLNENFEKEEKYIIFIFLVFLGIFL